RQRRLRGHGEHSQAREWAHAYGRSPDGCFDCHVLPIGRAGRSLKLVRAVVVRRPLEGDEQLAMRALEARVARRVGSQELPLEALVAMRAFDLERPVLAGRLGHASTLPTAAVRAPP